MSVDMQLKSSFYQTHLFLNGGHFLICFSRQSCRYSQYFKNLTYLNDLKVYKFFCNFVHFCAFLTMLLRLCWILSTNTFNILSVKMFLKFFMLFLLFYITKVQLIALTDSNVKMFLSVSSNLLKNFCKLHSCFVLFLLYISLY